MRSRLTQGRKQPVPATPATHPLYQPSIYTYTCRGAYHVSSGNKFREGTCRGFQSQLQHLTDMEVQTRSQALQDFTQWASGEDGVPVGGGLDGEEELHPAARLVSPVVIHPTESETQKNKTIESIEEQETMVVNSSLIPEEELVKHHDWQCYGATKVSYLQLKDVKTGTTHTSAVAPVNDGLSIREMEAADSANENEKHCVTYYRFGWLSVVVDSVEIEETTDGKADTTSIAAQSKQPVSSQSSDIFTSVKATGERVGNFSQLVFHHCVANTTWIVQNMQEDFPARTLASGQRLIRQVPITIDSSARFFGKFVWSLLSDDDDYPR